MNWRWLVLMVALSLSCTSLQAQTYLGFDRNTYPGDGNLQTLRKTFSYTGYWLNNPPDEKTNTWTGHRAAVESAGLGFLVLFNGRPYTELKSILYATRIGRADAGEALVAAHREGFPVGTLIFLDQEQGGRMLPEQKAYIYSWVDGVIAAGFRAGIYCSGISNPADGNVVTAKDIRQTAAGRKIVYWAINDACPPAPGCAFPKHPPSPAQSGISFAEVWQYAQSPQRKDVAGRCSNYNHDGNCYPPGVSSQMQVHVDVSTAISADPSGGRSR